MSTTQDSKKTTGTYKRSRVSRGGKQQNTAFVAVEEQNQGKDIRKIPTLMKIHHPSPPPPPSNNKLKKFLKMNNV